MDLLYCTDDLMDRQADRQTWTSEGFRLTSRPATRYVSAALHLCHARGADRFHSSLCVTFHQVRCAAYLLCAALAVQSPPAQIHRITISGGCSNSAKFSTEQKGSNTPKQQYEIRLLLKKNTLCDTSTQI